MKLELPIHPFTQTMPTAFSSTSELAQDHWGSTMSAFKPYISSVDHSEVSSRASTCSSGSQYPAGGIALPSMEDDDLSELLSSLPDFDDQVLDEKLSGIFDELDCSAMEQSIPKRLEDDLLTSLLDSESPKKDTSQCDSGIFVLSTNNSQSGTLTQASCPSDSLLRSGADRTTAVKLETEISSEVKLKVESDSCTKYLQWRNLDALCWLDVCLCLLVHSEVIKKIASVVAGESILSTILQAYTRAQGLFHKANSIQELNSEDVGRALKLETSIGRVSVRTGGGEIIDSISPSGLVMPTGESGPNLAKTVTNVSTATEPRAEAVRCLQQASNNLQDVRENIWKFLHSKLRCKRGQNDSPVFALPLLLGNHPRVNDMLKVAYRWEMICTQCGHHHQDHVAKILPTFPAVPPDFSMERPYFLRSCFQCKASNQELHMIPSTGYVGVNVCCTKF